MPYTRSSMRYGHADGFCTVSYEEEGEKYISVGFDGDIRIWDGFLDDDPQTKCIAEHVIAALQYSDKILVATEVNTVQIFKYPSLVRDGILFRFTAFATCLAKNERYIAAGSEDTLIQVAKVDDHNDIIELKGAEGPILSMDISKNDILAASSGDGMFRIWDLKTKNVLKVVDGLAKAKSLELVSSFSSPSFDPKSGKFMAYPKGKEVIVLETTKWAVVKVLKDDISGELFTCCAFSPMGDYVAAGTDKGEVVVWNFGTGKLVEGEKSTIDTNPLTRIDWCNKNNGELAISNKNGQVGAVHDAYEAEDEDLETVDPTEIAEKYGETDHLSGIVYDDDTDDDNENCVALGRLKSQIMKSDEDDANKMKAVDDDTMSDISAGSKFRAKSYPMQSIFQPGATPVHLEHRYLAYNHVGIVKLHGDGIDAEFHDSQSHHGIHTANIYNYTLAALSEDVFALACGPDDSHGSKLVCINLVSFGNRQWEYVLPELEEIVALTASDNIVAIGTDMRFLRIFSTKGTQREIVSVPGPIVCLAACGNKLIVAYHSSPASEDQHLNVMMITCTDFKLRCRDLKLPLTPGADLIWLGYTDKGSPVTFDSAGYLRLYHVDSNLWFPICDSKQHLKGASDNLYITKVSESSQQIQVIICKGARFPLTSPRPIPIEIPFRLPVCDDDADKSKVEDALVRYLYFNADDSEMKIKENFLKLFATACRNEMEPRAKELVEMMASPVILPLAAKYANKLGRLHLSDKIMELLPAFQEKEREKQQTERDLQEEILEEEQNFANNSTSSLITAAKERTETTPVIVPKPLEISQRKNPFKKNATPNSITKSNPLRHLTESAVGFSSPGSDSFTEDSQNLSGITPLSIPVLQESNKPKEKSKFIVWYGENKEEIANENPDKSNEELIKLATRMFKSLNAKPPTIKASEKRKLDEHDRGESGISKLAKFGFVKN